MKHSLELVKPEKEGNEMSKRKKRIKIHYGYDVSDISREHLFSIGYDKIYNKKGKLKKVNKIAKK